MSQNTVGKLGYGAYSTVWLCRDLSEHKHTFMALKVSTSRSKFPDATVRELRIYERRSSLPPSGHPGQNLIRGLYDTFELQGPDGEGQHQCILQPPLHMSLLEMMQMTRKPFDIPLLKATLSRLLTALDFLHVEAGIIHTDLKTDNIMLTVEDPTMLSRFQDAETNDPSPRKPIFVDESGSRTIYQSRRLPKPMDANYGLPVLCDFGEARIGEIQ